MVGAGDCSRRPDRSEAGGRREKWKAMWVRFRRCASAQMEGSWRLRVPITVSACGTAATGHLVRTLVDCDDLLYAVAFSPDSKLLAAGSWDGFVRIWDVNSGKLRITLVQKPLSRDGRSEWLAVSPDGRLDGSPEIRKLVRVRGTGSVENVHHTPGLLAESLQIRPKRPGVN